jgi:uncharacterized delta-60 repeat protein
MQSDGKIVMAGGSDSGPGGASRFTLVRYNSSGSLDTSFGGAGVVTTGFETVENFAGAWDVAIQADGKIVAAGGVAAGTVGGPDGFALARDNLDGSLDTTFDGDGRQTLQFGYSYPGPVMAIQSNGQIVLAGQILAPDENLALARVNTDGSLDTNFGTGGTVTTNIPGEARAVALQADGKIVAVGVSGGDFVAARFCP